MLQPQPIAPGELRCPTGEPVLAPAFAAPLCAPAGASLNAILRASPLLQLIVHSGAKDEKVCETLPAADSPALVATLRRFFERVDRMDGSFLLCGLRPEARRVWEQMARSRAIDPLLYHFSYSRHASPALPDDLIFFRLRGAADGASALADAPLFDTLLRCGCAEGRPLDVDGWTLDELCADPAVQALAGRVSALYYGAWRGARPCAQQLRFVL